MVRYQGFMCVALVLLSIILAGTPVTLAQLAGPVTQIDAPGARATYAHGINDGGQIVGPFVDAGGKWHGHMATPIR